MNDRGLHDLTEDATGFGRVEITTLWQSLRNPVQVLDAYMAEGPTGGGKYARPLRLYLTLCGILMVLQFLMGGMDAMLSSMVTPEQIAPMLQASGKSFDAFMADADGWGSFFTVPLVATSFALSVAPLLRWWDPENLGWRRAFRATFAYLNLWTLLMLPIGWLVYLPRYTNLGTLLILVIGVIGFVMMGKGRWWRGVMGAMAKSVLLMLVTMVASALASIPLVVLATLGALYGP